MKKVYNNIRMSKNSTKSIEDIVRLLLKSLGVDINDDHFKDTPKRVAKMLSEFTKALREPLPRVATFPCKEQNLIVVRDITAVSLCPHHFLPVLYKVHIGVVPNELILGLSKYSRIVRHLASRPISQEDFTQDIIDTINHVMKPLGVMAVVEGVHMCMKARGVKEPHSVTITSAISGVFADPPPGKNPREELLKILEITKEGT